MISASALDRTINRYYDPTTDQFLSVDPKVAVTNQPYVFTNDNPLNATDPLGLSGGPVVFGSPCKKDCVSISSDIAKHWRGIAKVATTVVTIAGAVACTSSLVCGVVVGGLSAAAYYSEGHAGTKSFSLAGFAESTSVGMVTGGVGSYGVGIANAGDQGLEDLAGQSFASKLAHPLQASGAYITNGALLLIGRSLQYGAPTVGLGFYWDDRR